MIDLQSVQRNKRYSTFISNKDHKVAIGGRAPVVIQSMTNTNTADVHATAEQIIQLYKAGSELVRITVNTADAARAVPSIRNILDAKGIQVPLIGDFHFNGHKLLSDYPECAQSLSKYRINPGNVGNGNKHDSQFCRIIEIACRYEKPIRIGVNWGSLDKDLLAQIMNNNASLTKPLSLRAIVCNTMIQSALNSADVAKNVGLPEHNIILSCKASEVQDLIAVYRQLTSQCQYALHLGLTEAGMGSKGIVASTAALSVLLQEGIGDTIRVSLTPGVDGDRSREVVVAQEILQSMGFRKFNPTVISCPGCGRTSSIMFQQLADSVQCFLNQQMPIWKSHCIGIENMKVAVMGCIVNGPGESRQANIGISLPGIGESSKAVVFIDGEKSNILHGENITKEFQDIITRYVNMTYSNKKTVAH